MEFACARNSPAKGGCDSMRSSPSPIPRSWRASKAKRRSSPSTDSRRSGSPRPYAMREQGVLFFDAISILGSHLAEVARTHAPSLFGRQEFTTLLEHLRASVPSLIKEVAADALPVAVAHKAFLALLRERIWPRDPVATLEALIDAAQTTHDPR